MKGGIARTPKCPVRTKNKSENPGFGRHLETAAAQGTVTSFGSWGWGESQKKGTASCPTAPPAKTIGVDPSGANSARGGQEPEVPVLRTSPSKMDPSAPTERRTAHAGLAGGTPPSTFRCRGLFSWTAESQQSYLIATVVGLQHTWVFPYGCVHVCSLT